MNRDTIEPAHILIVDIDPLLRQEVTRHFEEYNLPTSYARNRAELARQIAMTSPRLILLDLQHNCKERLDLLRSIRSLSNVPVVVTVERSDVADCVVGLELGADHSIVKPFSFRELLARIRAVLRRDDVGRAMHTLSSERVGYRFGGWQLDCRSMRLFDPRGALVSLGNKEYALLLAFLESPERLLSRGHLLQATRVYEDIGGRSIDNQIYRLRCKLDPDMIRTEYGAGYIFARPVDRI